MKELHKLTTEDIANMDYNQLISLVRETNRAPGGYKTIANVIHNTFLNSTHNVLEVGTSTGVTALELARLVGCHVDAIDINERSLVEARTRAKEAHLDGLIDFQQEDAQMLSFSNEMYDLVFCGNVTSLIPDRKKALAEYIRVLKKDGILVAVPMYYLRNPSNDLLNIVRNAIQTDVQVVSKAYWKSFYDHPEMVLKFEEDYKFDYIPDEQLERFIQCILGREFLQELKPEVYSFLREKYTKYLYLFRDNLAHMGYSILLYQKAGYGSEPELFRGTVLGGYQS